MENIKKLGYTKEEYGDNYRSREVDTEIEDVIDKVNEIIDRLNEQPEEKALHLPMTSKDLKEARKELQENTPEEWERIIKVKKCNNKTEELGIIVEDYSYIEIRVNWETGEVIVVGERNKSKLSK